MSIHPSLSASKKMKKQRSVLKRAERIKYLMEKGLFNEQTSVFGLPKIKYLKLKVKKEKAATAEKTEGAAPVAAGAAATPQAAAPAGKPAKESPQGKTAK